MRLPRARSARELLAQVGDELRPDAAFSLEERTDLRDEHVLRIEVVEIRPASPLEMDHPKVFEAAEHPSGGRVRNAGAPSELAPRRANAAWQAGQGAQDADMRPGLKHVVERRVHLHAAPLSSVWTCA